VTAEQLTIALITPVATLTVVMVGFLYNNARMSDLRGDVNSRLSDLRDVLKAELGRLEARIDRNHSEMLTRFGDLDSRLAHIKSQLGINKA
jgi:hypothetical protein